MCTWSCTSTEVCPKTCGYTPSQEYLHVLLVYIVYIVYIYIYCINIVYLLCIYCIYNVCIVSATVPSGLEVRVHEARTSEGGFPPREGVVPLGFFKGTTPPARMASRQLRDFFSTYFLISMLDPPKIYFFWSKTPLGAILYDFGPQLGAQNGLKIDTFSSPRGNLC